MNWRADFYSHASCEARLLEPFLGRIGGRFLLTRLLRGATNDRRYRFCQISISTHTPLARRDSRCRASYFSWPFLLTRLLRGATDLIVCRWTVDEISTHTPLARRDQVAVYMFQGTFISTHTPLARRDKCRTCTGVGGRRFLLTRLLRGATIINKIYTLQNGNFYSHASCEARRDVKIFPRNTTDFYSHASCEARQRT